MEREFEKLLKRFGEYGSKKGCEVVVRAWEFAKLAHAGQKRLTGDPYVSHPLEVAKILVGWRLDKTSVVAGFLHDTIEEGGAREADIIEEFGEEVARLVDGVTKITDIRLKGSKEKVFVENLRKMLLVMASDLRVVLVKLADRLHNMRTLAALSKEKQLENALETLEIYAPLAERLGIGEVKGKLEDLAFPYVYQKAYARVKKESRLRYVGAQEEIDMMKAELKKRLKKEKLVCRIAGRKKHLYSLWKKLERPEIDWNFDEINDIVALRIVVKRTVECYEALGIVHSIYKPVPHIGISDFIAQPKPNGYRSIHTKVFGPKGRVVEVQIRTEEMNEQAEYGIAAHWAYTEAKAGGAEDRVLEKGGVVAGRKLNWVKQLVNWQEEIKDSEEFLRAVKFDAFNHRNFVFSPKGDVYDLPSRATPVDYAFEVHTDLGNYIKGAKVNGRVVSLDYQLKSGDVVEIVKSKNPRKPGKNWLEFAVTTTARRKIKRAMEN